MARAAIAALVLCLAVLVAAAHAGRVIEYQVLEAGIDAAAAAPLAPLAAGASPSPASASADDVAADAGGVRTLGLLDDGRDRATSVVGDVVWWVLQWANQVAGGDRRRAF